MLFYIESLNIKIEIKEDELTKDMNELLDEYAPEGKSSKDFNGGYIQQLKNSNQLVAYFGHDKNNNRITIKITIDDSELDLFYIMLKAKIHEMKSAKTKTVRVSMAQRKLDKAKTKDEDWE